MTEDWRNGGFGLYVHWPFCQAKCPYCDFNSHVSQNIDQDAWKAAYLAEVTRSAAETPDRVLKSIYFGGGTPSLMQPGTVAAVIESACAHWTPANDIEITLEANPGSVEAARFAAYRDGGVNRVSLGIQAMNDDDLRRLGRIHTVAEALSAFDIARSCFDRVSFDLIYARQDQTLAQWEKELTAALAMAVDHLSLYQLTVEPGTAFGNRLNAGKLHGLPKEDLSADMYELTQNLCDAHGFPWYEVSNHARPGSESRHNLIYWQGGDYVGIGPGAHGRVTIGGTRFATESQLFPEKWLKSVASGSGESKRSQLTGLEQAEEYLMMGLRINSGIDIRRYNAMAAKELNPLARKSLADLGLVREEKDHIIVEDQGVMVLNAVISEFLSA